ncbi:MAG TPA: hypothetical protein ENI20_02560 [Bacteroides sp.]|nr:hypothetical protein [Bacteroides sp.]
MNSKEETYKKIYTLAGEIYKLKPWKWVFEYDVFGVRIPDTDRIYYVSVMGSEGEFLAISAYCGVRGLGQFWQFREQGDTIAPEAFLTIHQIMLSFGDREGLSPEQLASIKPSGISFRGKGCWPSLEEIFPAYLPVLPKGKSLSDTLVILEQTLNVAYRAEEEPDLIYPEQEQEDVYLIRERDGEDSPASWKDSYQKADTEQGEVDYKLTYMEESVRNVALLPESLKIIQIDLVMLPTPVKEKGHKGFFPFALIMVEKNTGLFLGMDTVAPKPNLDTMHESLPQRVLDEVQKLGFRPQRMEVRPSLLEGLIRQALEMAGIRLLAVSRMDSLDEAVLSLINHLEGGQPD